MESRSRPKMPVSQRAKQFLPFSALQGLAEALSEQEKILVPMAELSEDMQEELNGKMKKICCGKIISVVYFCKGETIRITGMVSGIDKTNRILQIVHTRIPFHNILKIEFCDS